MHKYNFVGINIQRIDGVINPILTVQGIIDKKKFIFQEKFFLFLSQLVGLLISLFLVL